MAKKLSNADLTKYERARIIGARALQLGAGAPPLIKHVELTTNAILLAKLEFDKGVIPLHVIRGEF